MWTYRGLWYTVRVGYSTHRHTGYACTTNNEKGAADSAQEYAAILLIKPYKTIMFMFYGFNTENYFEAEIHNVCLANENICYQYGTFSTASKQTNLIHNSTFWYKDKTKRIKCTIQ